MIDDLQLLIQKYSRKVQIRTQELVQDLQGIINKYKQQKSDTTLLEDVQKLYIAKHGKLPNNKKNDINRLSDNL